MSEPEFTIGETVNIEDLTEAEARAIFGDPLYETWLRTKDDPRPLGTCTVVGIDSGAGVLTLDDEDA